MAEEVCPTPDPREMDMLLSTGERMSCALCAMAINDLGHKAISLTGSQAGIVTDTSHTKARILDVRADRIREALDDEQIVLVAGFQGVAPPRTSPRSAAAARTPPPSPSPPPMDAEVCEIYTDVAGVFSADPRIVPDARKLPVVCFEEMLEMAASGARVLQLRSRRVRPQPRRPHPLPVELQRGPRYLCRRRGRDHGTTTDHRRHPLHRRGAHHAPRRPGQPGRRRPHLHRARRRERQRRHDHPERAGVRGRVGRHELHGPARRPPDRPQGARPGGLRASASSGSPRIRRWGRCRSWARE